MALVALSVVEQRLDAVRAVLAGASVMEVAAQVGVSRQSVHTWVGRYLSSGVAGLADRSSLSAYYLMCRLEYGLTCRSRRGDHGMGSPPVTRVSRSFSR